LATSASAMTSASDQWVCALHCGDW